MATDNQRDNLRDATPEDFAHDSVPTYTLAAGSTHAVDSVRTEVFAAPEPVPEPAPAPVPQPAAETAAIDREPQYIAPAEPVYEEVTVVSDPVEGEPVAVPVGRGTIDFGLLLLRLLVGGYLSVRAIATFFNLGSSGGIGALETAYASYPFGDGMAIIVPTLELAAGVFLVLGLITPVAAAVGVAVTGFEALHALTAADGGWGLLLTDATVILPALLLGLTFALTFTGPGLYSVDTGRGWARRPLASSWICALLGLAAAGAIWWFGAGVNPLA